MKSYRYWGLGRFAASPMACGLTAVMLISGGCQGPTKPTTDSKPASVQTQPQPADDARWKVDAAPTPEESLAKRTAKYVEQFQQDGTSPAVLPTDPPQPAFPRHPRKIETIPLDETETVPPATPHREETTDAAPVSPNTVAPQTAGPGPFAPGATAPRAAAVSPGTDPVITSPQPSYPCIDPNQDAKVAVLKQAAIGHPLNDAPVTLPESADFATAKPAPMSSVSPLEYRLHKRARDNPQDIVALLDLQLYAMLNDEPSPELAAVTLLPHQDQQLVNTLIDGLSEFRSAVREDPTMLQGKKIRPLTEMAERLRSQAPLEVPTVQLCKRVVGFGEYDAINPARFPAGRDSKVIVYCEVENFASKKIAADCWETRLTQKVTIYTDTGQYVWSDKARPIVDRSHRQRHDFYAYELLQLPADLTIGRYLLRVEITDENSGSVRDAENVPLTIGALEASADR